MAVEQIGNLYDLENIQAQTDAFIAYMRQAAAEVVTLNDKRINLKSADLSSFIEATQDLNKAINDSTASTTKATTANKELTKAQIEAKLANQQRTAAIKEEIVSSKAAAGSYNQLQSQLKTLTLEYKALSAEQRASPMGKELQQNILNTNAQLKIFDADLGNYQRNVGNYNSSLGNLSKGLKGIGGLGVILARSLGIDTSIVEDIREAGRAVRDLQHARELQEVGLRGEAALFEQTTAKMEANVAAIEGETVATVENTAAAETNAVATTEQAATTEAVAVAMGSEAVATEAATVATTTFSEVLAATGIGAAILAIGAGVYFLVQSIKDWDAAAESVKKANEDVTKSLKDLLDATKEGDDLNRGYTERQIDNLQKLIDQQKAAGVNSLEGLALEKQINDLRLKYSTEFIKQNDITAKSVEDRNSEAVNAAKIVQATEELKAKYIQETLSKSKIGQEEINKIASGQKEIDKTTLKLIQGFGDKDYDKKIKSLDEQIKKEKEEADLAKGLYERDSSAFTENENLKGKAVINTNQTIKESDDERRQFILQSTKLETDAVINKNALILSDERSTLDQRLEAIKSNAEQQSQYLRAQNTAVQSDPTKSTSEKLLAEKILSANLVKTYQDRNKLLYDTNESYRKRDAAAMLDYNNSILTADKTLLQQQLTDRFQDVQANVGLIKKEGEDEQQILDNNYLEKVSKAGLTNKEILDITQDYQAKTVQATYDTNEKIRVIEEKAVTDHIAFLKAQNQANIDAEGDKVDIRANTQQIAAINEAEAGILKANGEKKKRLETQLQDDLTEIINKAAIDRLNIQENELQAELAAQLSSGIIDVNAVTKIQAEITAIELKKDKITTDSAKEAADKKKAIRDKEAQDFLTAANTELEVIQAIADGQYQKQSDAIQKQQDLDDAQEQRDIDKVNASTATAAEKADQIAVIEARATQEKAANDLKERKIEHDKAKFDKEIAILQIIAQIAIDIATARYGAAALAGAALIKLIATPVPAYKGGRGEGKDELAIVGDGGVSEYIQRSNGTIEKTPAVETLTHLMPKDRVFKDKAAMMKELALSSLQLSDFHVNESGGIQKSDMERMTGEIVNAVGDIRIQTQMVTKAGWRSHNQRLSDYDKWVNKFIKN